MAGDIVDQPANFVSVLRVQRCSHEPLYEKSGALNLRGGWRHGRHQRIGRRICPALRNKPTLSAYCAQVSKFATSGYDPFKMGQIEAKLLGRSSARPATLDMRKRVPELTDGQSSEVCEVAQRRGCRCDRWQNCRLAALPRHERFQAGAEKPLPISNGRRFEQIAWLAL